MIAVYLYKIFLIDRSRVGFVVMNFVLLGFVSKFEDKNFFISVIEYL